MAFIYGNSALLFLEIFDPVYGYFHGIMLALSLSFGYGFLFVIGYVAQKTIHIIEEVDNEKSKVTFLSYYRVSFNFSK